MTDENAAADTPKRPTVVQAMGMLVAIAVAVFGYATLCSVLGIALIHGGFLFLFYWAGIRAAAFGELIPSALGALGGIGLAWLVMTLPAQMGTAGYAVIAVAIVACIFMMIRGHLPVLINNAFMLFLTVFTIPGVAGPTAFVQAAASVLIASGLALLVLLGVKGLGKRKGGVPVGG